MGLCSLPQRAARFAAIVCLAVLSLTAARADAARPFLHPLFTDNMVLQRGIPDPVWGWTTPGTAVTVRVAGNGVLKGAKAVAGADGAWMAHLPPLPVGGPYTLTVSGPQTVTLTNVLVGDVWICSGQSNMVFGVGAAINGPAEVAAANYPNIRLFTVGNSISLEPRRLLTGQWQTCTPATIMSQGTWSGFSAVGYFFGRDLQQAVPTPIGLICTAWSGSAAEAWTSREALQQKLPEFAPALTQLDAARTDTTTMEQKMAAWYERNDPGLPAGWQDAALDDSAWKRIPLPGYFQDAGIPELRSINGLVWFRRTFDLPASDVGKAAILHLLTNDTDITWINGTPIGTESAANTLRNYAVAPELLKPTGNVVAVRVLNARNKGGIKGVPAGLTLEVPGGQNVPLAGPWRYHIGISLARAPLPEDIPNDPHFPTVLYNGMISPLIPFGVKGAIWYQGESNAGNARQYQTLLPAMIEDWRSRFGVGDFPFLIVQLARYGPTHAQPVDTGWVRLREAQFLTTERVPNTGLAVADDIGDGTDVHPKNKQEVGRRLALTAEAVAYDMKVEYSGPIYGSMTVEGGTIRLHFTHLGGGLVAKGGDKLTGFAIAGADGKFVWADARIDGATVVVSSPDVVAPTAVRYAWDDTPVCNLYNQADLPAVPFRTGSGAK